MRRRGELIGEIAVPLQYSIHVLVSHAEGAGESRSWFTSYRPLDYLPVAHHAFGSDRSEVQQAIDLPLPSRT